jgi:hypothetical protein
MGEQRWDVLDLVEHGAPGKGIEVGGILGWHLFNLLKTRDTG